MSDVATNEGLTGKTVVLGLQHTFVMFGATVLVPIITGLDVGVALFAAGIGTLIFHFLTKMKVPVFLGSSFSFMPPIIAVAEASGGDLAFATGGILVAGLVYVVVAVIFKFVNFKWLQLILPAHVTGPIIILIGLLLANVAINNASGNWWIAALTFAFGVFVKIGFERFGWKFLSALPILLALIFGYIISIVWGIVDFSSVNDAAWVGIPNFMLPKFSGSALALIVPVAIVTIVEHFGDVIAIGDVVKQNFLKDPGVHRTLLGDGIATSVSALLGGPANTTYSENTGAVALTGVKNPAVMRIAAVFAILLSLIPKFNALIGTIPGPVIGGISILLFGMISSIGIRNMIDARVNMDDPRPLIISAAMLVLGVGNAAFVVGGLTLSGLALSAIVGIVLNVLINFRSFKNASSEQPGAMG
ncbi:MAG: uracil-xanthine permease family protein [Spirochaetales bacterium]